MTDTTRAASADAVDAEEVRKRAEAGRELLRQARDRLRRGLRTAGVAESGQQTESSRRRPENGRRDHARTALYAAVVVLPVAVALLRQLRTRESGVDQRSVADTSPDVEQASDGLEDGGERTGDAAAAVADTGTDLEGAGSSPEIDSGDTGSVTQRDVADTGVDSDDLAEATEADEATGGEGAGEAAVTEAGKPAGEQPESGTADAATSSIDRLGEAAMDARSREVPAPQRAFNQGYLAHSTEAFWGVREHDGAVLASRDYDAVADREGVRYVASSTIGDDVRELPIPAPVMNHWDEVAGGGTAVTGGNDVLFATTDDLAEDGLLWVLPAEWADEAFGED